MPIAYRRAVVVRGGIRDRSSQPLRDHRHAHHDVAADRGDVRGPCLEHRRHASRENQRAGHLHEHGEAVPHIIAVVGRSEPGEVHPGPPDGEEDHQVSEQGFDGVGVGNRVVQTAGRLSDRDDEDEVEEQLEGRRGAVRFVRRPRRHRSAKLRAVIGVRVCDRVWSRHRFHRIVAEYHPGDSGRPPTRKTTRLPRLAAPHGGHAARGAVAMMSELPQRRGRIDPRRPDGGQPRGRRDHGDERHGCGEYEQEIERPKLEEGRMQDVPRDDAGETAADEADGDDQDARGSGRWAARFAGRHLSYSHRDR